MRAPFLLLRCLKFCNVQQDPPQAQLEAYRGKVSQEQLPRLALAMVDEVVSHLRKVAAAVADELPPDLQMLFGELSISSPAKVIVSTYVLRFSA